MSNFELANLMQHLGAAMQKLSADDVALLLANKASVEIVVTRSTGSQPSRSDKVGVVTPPDFELIAVRLDAALSREDGAVVLDGLNKIQLQSLAKHFSVSVDSSATKDKLIEKIVERKVGLRLRQDAFSQVMNPA